MRFGKVPGKIFWFLVDGWMDGITKGILTGMERKLVGFDARLKERRGKEKLVKGALFDFFHIFFFFGSREMMMTISFPLQCPALLLLLLLCSIGSV